MESAVLDAIRRTVNTKEPTEIRISKAPKKNDKYSYISLGAIGVKPGDRIAIIVYDDTLIVKKLE